jgi:WD40 repeat protein
MRRRAWSHDGKFLLLRANSGRSVITWDATSGEVIRSLDVAEGHSIASSFGGQLIATDCMDAVQIWQADTGKLIHTLKCVSNHYPLLRCSPNAKMLARAPTGGAFSGSGTITMWDLASGEELWTIKTGHRTCCAAIAWSPDGETLASCGGGGEVRLWESESGDLIEQRQLVPGKSYNYLLSWANDGTTISVADVGVVVKWDIETDTVRTASAPGGELTPDGKYLARKGMNQTVEIWDTESGSRCGNVSILRDYQPLSVSANGHFIAPPTIGHKLIYVVQTDSGEQITLTPTEFEKKYGWKNDPTKVSLLAGGGESSATPPKDTTSREPHMPPAEPGPKTNSGGATRQHAKDGFQAHRTGVTVDRGIAPKTRGA